MDTAQKRKVGRPFQPGQSGNPSGRPKAFLTHALKAKLTPERAEKLAEVLLARAEAGESWAMEKVFDRIEGKVPNKNENGQPGDFEADLDGVESETIRAALRRVK